MSVFGKLFGAAIDVVTLPVAVVADVVMIPVDATDLSKPVFSRTGTTLGRIADKVTDAADEAAKP